LIRLLPVVIAVLIIIQSFSWIVILHVDMIELLGPPYVVLVVLIRWLLHHHMAASVVVGLLSIIADWMINRSIEMMKLL